MIDSRNPQGTRQRILESAFWQSFRLGFRGASLDQVLAETGVTKGALYHHFPSKTELGYAIIEEMIGEWIHDHWTKPLGESEDPITTIQGIFDRFQSEMTDEMAKLGCPLNNLTQEMSGIDEGFRERLQKVMEAWIASLADAFERGKRAGTVSPEVDPRSAATFVVAVVEGLSGVMKNAGSKEGGIEALGSFRTWLDSLRPTTPSTTMHEEING